MFILAGSAAPRPPPSNHSNFAPLQQNPNTHSHPSTATQASQQSCIGQAQAHLPPCTILRASPTLDPQTDHTLQAAVQATAYLPQVSVQQHEKHHRAHIVLLPCKEHEDAIMTSGTADDDASKEHASCSRHAHVLAHASRDGTHSRSTSSRVLMKRNSSRKGRRKLMQCSSNSSSKSRSKSSFARRGLSNPAQAAGAPASDAAAMRPDTAGKQADMPLVVFPGLSC